MHLFVNVFDQILEKFQEILTVTLLGLTVCSLISIKNILCGLCLYLCNQIALYITQMTRRFFFFGSKHKCNFYILDITMIQTQTMQPHFFINPLKHSGFYWTIRTF